MAFDEEEVGVWELAVAMEDSALQERYFMIKILTFLDFGFWVLENLIVSQKKKKKKMFFRETYYCCCKSRKGRRD